MRLSMRGPAVLVLVAGLALAGCGTRNALALKPGQSAPPAAYGSSVRPTADDLLATPTLAIPERSVELRTRSEPREDDPFDMPPPERPQPQPSETAAAPDQN